jgi:hypothetical protein
MTIPTGAWTPGAPDSGLADDPAALIAHGDQAPYDATQDDRFDPADLCDAVLDICPRDGHSYQRYRCEEDPGHYPDTPHQATIAWTEPQEAETP